MSAKGCGGGPNGRYPPLWFCKPSHRMFTNSHMSGKDGKDFWYRPTSLHSLPASIRDSEFLKVFAFYQRQLSYNWKVSVRKLKYQEVQYYNAAKAGGEELSFLNKSQADTRNQSPNVSLLGCKLSMYLCVLGSMGGSTSRLLLAGRLTISMHYSFMPTTIHMLCLTSLDFEHQFNLLFYYFGGRISEETFVYQVKLNIVRSLTSHCLHALLTHVLYYSLLH